jgi:hypothetical protein
VLFEDFDWTQGGTLGNGIAEGTASQRITLRLAKIECLQITFERLKRTTWSFQSHG